LKPNVSQQSGNFPLRNVLKSLDAQIGPAAERRNGGPADPKTLSSREPQRRRKLAVVSI
jgi:hypothetical protein